MKLVSFKTELGHMALAFRRDVLATLVFGHATSKAACRAIRESSPDFELSEGGLVELRWDCDELVGRLRAFAHGDAVDFSDVPVDDSYATPFQRRVLHACRNIPWGETVTYGTLAARAGRPGAARAVGSVMAGNRVPLIIPCHRVVPVSGGLGGFSAPQGVKMKRRLLDAERCLAIC